MDWEKFDVLTAEERSEIAAIAEYLFNYIPHYPGSKTDAMTDAFYLREHVKERLSEQPTEVLPQRVVGGNRR